MSFRTVRLRRVPGGMSAGCRTLLILAAAAAAAGCDAFGPDEATLAGHRPLIRSHTLSDFDFGADSRTLYFIAIDNERQTTVGVSAVDAVTGRGRLLAAGLPARNGMAQYIRAPRNSNYVYVSLTQDIGCTPAVLWRVPTTGGAADTVAGDVNAAVFIASADGTRLSFVATQRLDPTTRACPQGADSLVVLRPSTAGVVKRRVIERDLTFGVTPISISDAGDLLYFRPSGPPTSPSSIGFLLAPGDGGPAREVLNPEPGSFFSLTISSSVIWSDGNPRVLIAKPTPSAREIAVVSRDAVTGADTPLGTVLEVAQFGPLLASSADGNVLAMWVPVEDLSPPGAVERRTLRYRLYVGGVGRTPRSVLEFVSTSNPWKLRVSPDGQRAAFRLNENVYVIPT